LQITDILLSHSLREFSRKIKSTISNELTIGEGMKISSLGAMDVRWKWSKVCDIEVTPSGLWTLAGSGETL
jgi:hypothetical protein